VILKALAQLLPNLTHITTWLLIPQALMQDKLLVHRSWRVTWPETNLCIYLKTNENQTKQQGNCICLPALGREGILKACFGREELVMTYACFHTLKEKCSP